MKTLRVWLDEDGNEYPLPMKREVCFRCNGEGTHDAWEGDIPSDEIAAEWPEFYEDYKSGVYNVPCNVCHGNKVVDLIDYDNLSPEASAYVTEWENAEALDCSIRQAETRMGC